MKAIRDLINGNITAAKNSAQHFSSQKIYSSSVHDYGMTVARALATTYYLKGKITFQKYCDLTR